MKKLELKGLDMTLYKEKFNNGLEIYLLPYPNKKNYFISYATHFGSDILSFVDKDNKTHTPPLGVAHFLEHKMFDQETGEDPFAFFSKSGTDANASTSYDNTQYICMGTKNFRENLRYLLKYVNSPYYTDTTVEKEKGIIAEEIKMYDDIPDYKLEAKLRECLYKNSPRRIDIAGTVEEINKITKEDLYECYNGFYKPNNMFIVIVGNFSLEDAIEVIKEELKDKEESTISKIEHIKEPKKVNEKELVIKENIEVSKLAFGLKVPIKDINMKEEELDLYLGMITNILFGASSEFRERVRKAQLLNNIYTEWEALEDYRTFYLMASTKEPDKLLSEIKDELSSLALPEKVFKRIKKVWIANEVKMIDDIDATMYNLFDDITKYNKVINNRLELIRKMSITKLKEVVKKIDFNNTSVVKMLCNEKED